MNASGWLLARLTVLGALSASGMTAALPVHADDASPEPSQRSAATELAALQARVRLDDVSDSWKLLANFVSVHARD